jgi:hypothetical protein
MRRAIVGNRPLLGLVACQCCSYEQMRCCAVGGDAIEETAMPDRDHFEPGIRYALKHGPVAQAARRGLSEHDLDYLCSLIAEQLRWPRWRQLPPEPIGPSAQAQGSPRTDPVPT